MDFFEHQERARRSSLRLVAMFIVAVLVLSIAVYAATAILVGFTLPHADLIPTGPDPAERIDIPRERAWAIARDWRLAVALIGGTLLIVGVGTGYKLAQLRGGGEWIARSMGGRLLYPDATDPDERKVLNIVEEMAIASGIPAPPVFLMDRERSINAFAAGSTPGDAVIGVTRGCVELLNRDELQGVVAHEFSHILNGDMRLNMRLIGLVHGLLVLGLLGYSLLRIALYSGATRVSSSRRQSPIPIIALGAILLVVGYLGVFLGNLIKAAVSRQREFLADASAVQFTRNPAGIAGALRKIGGLSLGARISHPNAAEASHMFFGRALTTGMMSLFSTHPPLPVRIRRIDPAWSGSFPHVEAPEPTSALARQAMGLAPTPEPRPAILRRADHAAAPPPPVDVGLITAAHLAYAEEIRADIPQPILDAAHEPFASRAVILVMLADQDDAIRRAQIQPIAERDPALARAITNLIPAARRLDRRAALPLIDTTIGTLRALSPPQYRDFRDAVTAFVHADKKIAILEWVIQRMVIRHLNHHFGIARPPRAQYYAMARLGPECTAMLSMLARAGHAGVKGATAAFDAGARYLRVDGIAFDPKAGLGDLDAALKKLELVTPKLKRSLVDAAVATIVHDREVSIREAELVRAIADSLDCPIPPLLPGQPLIAPGAP